MASGPDELPAGRAAPRDSVGPACLALGKTCANLPPAPDACKLEWRGRDSGRGRVTIDPDSFQYAGIVRPGVVSGNNVIVKTQGHDVFAFDIATGERRWKFDADYGYPTMGSEGLSACDGRVIVATGDLGLVALDAATGWRGAVGLGP